MEEKGAGSVELPRFGGVFRVCVSSLFLMQFFISYRRIIGNGYMQMPEYLEDELEQVTNTLHEQLDM